MMPGLMTNDPVADLLRRAHAVHPASWVPDRDFVEHAMNHAGSASELSGLHAADLYLALACARGIRDALQFFEVEHFAHVDDFIARVDSSQAVADEVRQTLRHRLLVSSPEAPARILGYTGRGPIGGWLRVCAVREAQSAKREGRRQTAMPDLKSDEVDPELAWLKEKYGEAVSDAFKDALASIDPDARTMLRMHYVDGLTIEQVGQVFRVSRATAARMLLKAREALVTQVRERLHADLGVNSMEAHSLLELVRSRIDLSLRRHLS
jgi:RNA polymerase sigma-70 factor, ECF subfamily